ncbi:MAG: DUF3710 domain-containing protein [Geodermatophilaceae bacterium]|nr:DUF3710 domain-containing protein [Geodermatophilaceae bacterium]
MPFGRRRRLDRSVREKGVAPEPESRDREQTTTTGPYDVHDAPEDSLLRIDLGTLRIAPVAGGDLRLDVNKAGKIMSATLRHQGSAMQVGAFAAPRQGGIWSDVRAEILATLGQQGGTGEETKGAFGTELAAKLAMKQGPQPARFIGVDGPRWFLRALITGPAATDDGAAKPFEQALRQIIVVRGSEPMPVREQLPLRLPTDPRESQPAEADSDSEDSADQADQANQR